MFRRTRIRHRLLALTAAYGLLMMTITLLLWWQVRESHSEVQQVVARGVDESHAFSQLQQMLRALAAEWNSAVNDPAYHPPLAVVQKLQTASLESFGRAPVPRELRTEIREITGSSVLLASEWPTLPRTSRMDRAGQLDQALSGVLRRLEKARGNSELGLRQALERLGRRMERTSLMALAIVYLVAIGSLLVAQRALSRIVFPIERLSAAADRVARGELDTRIPPSGDYEIAHLGERFNEMTASLAESRKKLEQLARVDELTGLPNFRTFRARIEEEIDRFQRYKHPFGLLVLDLDRFKRYNDTWGHQAGNEALAAVASALRSSVRAVDFPARFGGEEFAIIAPQTDREALQILAERIRSAVEEIPPIEGRDSLTVSIGGAMFPEDAAAIEPLFEMADERLYEAKEAGRNRHVTG